MSFEVEEAVQPPSGTWDFAPCGFAVTTFTDLHSCPTLSFSFLGSWVVKQHDNLLAKVKRRPQNRSWMLQLLTIPGPMDAAPLRLVPMQLQ